jgi:hypothetical protein
VPDVGEEMALDLMDVVPLGAEDVELLDVRDDSVGLPETLPLEVEDVLGVLPEMVDGEALDKDDWVVERVDEVAEVLFELNFDEVVLELVLGR